MNIFSQQNRRNSVYIVVTCILIYLIGNMGNRLIRDIIILFFAGIGSVFFDISYPLTLYAFVFIVGLKIDTWAEAGIMVVALIPYIFRNSLTKKQSLMLIFPPTVFLISFLFGYTASISFLIVQLFAYISFVIVGFGDDENAGYHMILAFILAGFCVMITIIGQIRGDASLLLDRLRLNDNARSLANALIVPVFYFLTKMIAVNNEQEYTKFRYKLIYFILSALFGVLMLFTYSRGNILALSVGLFVFLLLAVRENGIKQVVFIGILIFLFYSFYKNLGINTNRMVSTTSAEIRLDVYKFYLSKLTQNGFLRFLLGFGPGDIRRVAYDEYLGMYYAHSAILDYFYQYGLCGEGIVLFMIAKAGKAVLKSCNARMAGFCVMTILMFFPYGSCENFMFHIMLGMCCNQTLLYGWEDFGGRN